MSGGFVQRPFWTNLWGGAGEGDPAENQLGFTPRLVYSGCRRSSGQRNLETKTRIVFLGGKCVKNSVKLS